MESNKVSSIGMESNKVQLYFYILSIITLVEHNYFKLLCSTHNPNYEFLMVKIVIKQLIMFQKKIDL